jgi:outer membrane protein assembly factor BamB
MGRSGVDRSDRRWRRAAGAALCVAGLLAATAPQQVAAETPPVVVPRPDLGPIPDMEDFVAQQFQDFQGRPPTTSEQAAYASQLRLLAASPDETLTAIAQIGPASGRQAAVVRLYRAFFERLPDPVGLAYWEQKRADGRTLVRVASTFAKSSEFQRKYGALDNGGYVDRIYRNVLGRPADPSGAAFWTQRLDGGLPRGGLVVSFSESAENVRKARPATDLVRVVTAMLHRVPTADELNATLARPEAPAFGPLAVEVLRGAEYRALHPEAVSTGYQINASHDGTQPIATLPEQPRVRWTKDFGTTVGYPVITGGRVFVVVRASSGNSYGTRLYALDIDDGSVLWGPIVNQATYFRAGLTAGEGRVYQIDYDGVLRAFDETNGNELWSRDLPGQYSFSSPPTYEDGTVYIGGSGSGGTLYAVDAASGAVNWTAPVDNGDQSAPAVDDTSVFVTYACGVAHKFDRASGVMAWTKYEGCSGGGGRTGVLHGGRLYVRDFQYQKIRDAGSGDAVGTFGSQLAPSFDDGRRLEVADNTLQAVDEATGSVVWSRTVTGGIVTAPVVTGGRVFVGSSAGKAYGYDTATGTLEWSASAGASFEWPDEHNVSGPLAGSGIGNGLLVMATSRGLVAFG